MSIIDYQHILENLKVKNKTTMVSISTTANTNNKELIISSLRETKNSVAVNFILRNKHKLREIISFFDGKIDYFLLDTEIKNELINLAELASENIIKTKLITFKPNDFTISSLDSFLSVKFRNLLDKRIFISGAGNIGIKSAIMLSEKGAMVFINGRNKEKTLQIANGINLFIRAKHKITAITQIQESSYFDIAIGCSNGTPVIDTQIASITKELIIDAGNGTIDEKAIALANQKSLPIIVLSSLPGYIGFIENLEKTIEIQAITGKAKISANQYLLSPGILGAKGDIIVDNPQNPKKIIAVCDGKGDVLYQQEANLHIETAINQALDKKLALHLSKIYFNHIS